MKAKELADRFSPPEESGEPPFKLSRILDEMRKQTQTNFSK